MLLNNLFDFISNNVGYTVAIVAGVSLVNYSIYYFLTKNSSILDNSSVKSDFVNSSNESTITRNSSTWDETTVSLTTTEPSLQPIQVNTELFHELVRELKVREITQTIDISQYGETVDSVRAIISKFSIEMLQNPTVNETIISCITIPDYLNCMF